MGQRLNLEIHKDGEVLANAYYHWSGYTSSSIELTKEVLKHVDQIKEDNEIVYAIRLLEATGAGLTDDELPFVQKIAPEKEFKIAINRNRGLIAISEEGIEETRRWEEGRVEVDLSNQTVNFNVCFINPKDEFIENYGVEDYKKCPNYPFSYPFDSIPFSQFNAFASVIEDLIQNCIYAVKEGKGKDSDVIVFIE